MVKQSLSFLVCCMMLMATFMRSAEPAKASPPSTQPSFDKLYEETVGERSTFSIRRSKAISADLLGALNYTYSGNAEPNNLIDVFAVTFHLTIDSDEELTLGGWTCWVRRGDDPDVGCNVFDVDIFEGLISVIYQGHGGLAVVQYSLDSKQQMRFSLGGWSTLSLSRPFKPGRVTAQFHRGDDGLAVNVSDKRAPDMTTETMFVQEAPLLAFASKSNRKIYK